MSDLLKKVKVQNNDGSYSNPIMVSTDGDYIFCYNGKTLNETLRDISSSLLNTIDGSLTFYYLATYLERGVTINTPGWTTTMQQMTNQKRYLWMYCSYQKTNGITERISPVIIGVRGADGQKGDTGDPGTSGLVINGSTVSYGVSSSDSIEPSNWGSSMPPLSKGDWLWIKTTYTYSSGNPQVVYNKSYVGTDGQNGTSVYVQSSSKVDGVTTVTLTDGTVMTIADGQEGDQGIPGQSEYVHIAWATAADGSTGFSTSISEGKTYIGVYNDQNSNDSLDPGDYNWSRIKGADGTNGHDGTGINSTVITYGKSNSSSIEPQDWFSTVPLLNPGQWLWTKTVYTYTNGNDYTTYSKSYVGTNGDDGAGIVSTQPQYYLSIYPNDLVGGNWVTTLNYVPGKYIWTRQYYTYDDGSDSTSVPIYDAALTQSCIDSHSALAIAESTNQYFWHFTEEFYLTEDTTVDSSKDYYELIGSIYTLVVPIGNQNPSEEGWYEVFSDTGAHITEIPQEDFMADPANAGGNLLARSNGIAIRDGLNELATFSANGIGLFDGQGNASSNELAVFGVNGARIGKEDSANFNITPATTFAKDVNRDKVFEIYSGGDEETAEYSERSIIYRPSNPQTTSINLQNPRCVDGENININIKVYFFANVNANNTCSIMYTEPDVGETLTVTDSLTIYHPISSALDQVDFTITGTFKQLTVGDYTTTINIECSNFNDVYKIEYEINYTSYRSKSPSYTLGVRNVDDPKGDYSIVEGYNNIASGKYSHAEGNRNTASGNSAHVEGNVNTASGSFSHAEGDYTKALGASSHAEGDESQATGPISHAEGNRTIASGDVSHAEGNNTEASGKYSHAGGNNTIAASTAQTVIGKYNVEDVNDTYAFIIGNGTGTSSRTNAFTVDWNGVATASSHATPSDIRLKQNIQNTDVNALEVINKIKMRQFDWKRTGEHQKIGFIADELEQIDSRMVIQNGQNSYKSVESYYLVGYLVKAVQELSAEVDKLKQEIETLKN